MAFARVNDWEMCEAEGCEEGADGGDEGSEAGGCGGGESGEVAACGEEVVLHVDY